ncbi:hypothetical protein B0O80DRAFT_471996 [Mortierella sp. GBAus27b]|nr:hypothetical protein B0O80DRAFT_471996 [Mortierella sp. GBAus27b]
MSHLPSLLPFLPPSLLFLTQLHKFFPPHNATSFSLLSPFSLDPLNLLSSPTDHHPQRVTDSPPFATLAHSLEGGDPYDPREADNSEPPERRIDPQPLEPERRPAGHDHPVLQ